MNLKEKLGKKTTNLNDHTLVNNAIAAKAASSNAYLNATLSASTPELKGLFSAALTQVVGEHTGLATLALNKGWTKPYDNPEKQLLQSVTHSKEVLDTQITEY